MSFVIGKAQKPNIFKQQTLVPGPGNYEYDLANDISQRPAPFNSSQTKKSTFDIIGSRNGPGSYNDADVKKKLASTRVKMASSFISKVDRFNKTTDQNILSTDKFEHNLSSKRVNGVQGKKLSENRQQSKLKLQQLRRMNRQRRIQSIQNNKEYVRIVLTSPKITENLQSIYVYKNVNQKNNGPGNYEIPAKNNTKCIMNWIKQQNVRTSKIKKNSKPGPGQYELSSSMKKTKNRITPSFSYQGMRSYMDTLIYKTNIPLKMQVIKQRKLKDRFPGPGTYELNKNYEKSNKKQNKFGIKQDRFNNGIKQKIQPGPADYSSIIQNNEFKNNLKETRRKIFKHEKIKNSDKEKEQNSLLNLMERKIIVIDKQFENQNRNFYSLKERCTSKFGTLGQQLRFKFKTEEQPGPGQYSYQDKYKHTNGIIMKSQSQKKYKCINTEPAQQFYDIEGNDIGKKIDKIKKNMQELKKVNLEKVPFNTGKQRFSSQKIYYLESDTKYKDSKNNKRIDNNKSKPLGNSIFQSTSKREIFKTEIYPGPCHYNHKPLNLQKQSFNCNYNYQTPIKKKVIQRSKSSLQ